MLVALGEEDGEWGEWWKGGPGEGGGGRGWGMTVGTYKGGKGRGRDCEEW